MITEETINEIISKIIEVVNPDKVILFGSYAYGSPSENSDLDLLIIKDMDIPMGRRGREIRKHLKGIRIPMDILVYTQEEVSEWQEVEGAFITQVIKQGKIFYSKNMTQ